MTDKLFGTWLAQTRELQTKSFGYDPGLAEGAEREQFIKDNVLAAEDELHEALAEISWKPWASSKFFNREAYIGELVDALHFVANLAVAAGCTDDELNAAYEEKMERNRKRQAEGYTGLDKCVKCRRAVDDVLVHSGNQDLKSVKFLDELGGEMCAECAQRNPFYAKVDRAIS